MRKSATPLIHLGALILSAPIFLIFLYYSLTEPAPFQIIWTLLAFVSIVINGYRLCHSLHKNISVYEPRCQLEAQSAVEEQMKNDGIV